MAKHQNVRLSLFMYLMYIPRLTRWCFAVPYPYAIEEGFDVYTVLHQTAGRIIGMSGVSLDVIMSGDSA